MTGIGASVRRRWPLAFALAGACAGCAAPAGKPSDAGATAPATEPAEAATAPRSSERPREPPPMPVKGLVEQEFEQGVQSYADCEYKASARQLQAAIPGGDNLLTLRS